MSIIGYALGATTISRSGTITPGDAASSPTAQQQLIDESRTALRKVRDELGPAAGVASVINARDVIERVDSDLARATSGSQVNGSFNDGLGRLTNTLQALFPAEALILNAGLLLATVAVPVEEDAAYRISNAPALIWGTVAITLITVVIYYGAILIARRSWQRADYWRMLIPLSAYLCWSLLQPVSAFVLVDWLRDRDIRMFIGLALAVLVGVAANVRDSRADP